jgi:hypothetical protein
VDLAASGATTPTHRGTRSRADLNEDNYGRRRPGTTSRCASRSGRRRVAYVRERWRTPRHSTGGQWRIAPPRSQGSDEPSELSPERPAPARRRVLDPGAADLSGPDAAVPVRTEGERSIAYIKAFRRAAGLPRTSTSGRTGRDSSARRCVVADLLVVAVIPRSRSGSASRDRKRAGREEVQRAVRPVATGSPSDLERLRHTIYVLEVCVVDDIWCGRVRTTRTGARGPDSEISCAKCSTRDWTSATGDGSHGAMPASARRPSAPGGHDTPGSRSTWRTRSSIPRNGSMRAWPALDAWHDTDGARPPGVRRHPQGTPVRSNAGCSLGLRVSSTPTGAGRPPRPRPILSAFLSLWTAETRQPERQGRCSGSARR